LTTGHYYYFGQPEAQTMSTPTTAVVCLGGAAAPQNDDAAPLSVSVKSKSDLATAVSVPSSSLSSMTIRVSAAELALYDPMALASLVSSLAPGGAVQVEILGGNNGGSDVDLTPVNDSFLLAGLGAESERRDGTSRILTARKKKATDQEPASNKSAPIKLNLGGVGGGGSSAAVKINLGGGDEDEDDMVDEDDLLAEEGAGVLAPPPAVDAAARAAAADDCGGRKACDNCTCGRAEREAMERAGGGAADENQPRQQVPSSSCGNCAKGDAFRCAGCPFLGKPAFKPGEEHLVLDLADDL